MDAVILALRVLLSLAVVLGLLWYMHRRISRASSRGGKVSLVNVVARHGISPKASVVIVEAEGQRFLLGVTEQSVNVLHASEAPAALTAVPTHDDDGASFAKVLSLASRSSTPDEYADNRVPAPATRRTVRAQHSGALSQGNRSSGRRAARTAAPSSNSPLAGSILSPETWKQTANAFRQGLG